MVLSFFHSHARLNAPKHFQKRLFQLIKTLPESRSDAFPAAHLIAGEAPFLHARFRALQGELRSCPPLPKMDQSPRMLLCARAVSDALPLHAGKMLHAVRSFYGEKEPTGRELDYLFPAVCCALMEKLYALMAVALHPTEEEKALKTSQECALILQALHALPRLPQGAIMERLNPVDSILRGEETYRLMDRESRRYYRDLVCRLAQKCRRPETAVARAALNLTEGKTGVEKESGYYLTEQPEMILAALGKRSRFFSPAQKSRLYILPLCLFALLFAVAFILLKAPVWLLPFGLFAISEHARNLYYPLLRRLFGPRMLPRLNKRCIENERLLIVVPTLLTSTKQALQMAHQLQTLHAATPHAAFMLLGDFADSDAQLTQDDLDILHTAKAAIHALNEAEKGRFFYLHRQRVFDEKQKLYTGRERKRGALEDLNLLLCGEECPDPFVYASMDPATLKGAFDAVITLDADTFLPPGAAAKLQGALAHPLQKGRISVIQPRMATLSKEIHTRTQHFFTAQGAVDSYHTLVQNVYQDVFSRGSFAGKGIYRPADFLHHTLGKLPDGQILSHDLIEGELAGSALAEDIVCFDGPPSTVSGLMKRLHRWTRGDWQLIRFLFDKKLSLLSRWKMYDNLRASLVPVSELALLLLGCLLQNPFLMLLGLPYPFHGLAKRLIALPGKAVLQLDAAVRALWRLFISRKHLLSWVTASQAEGKSGISGLYTGLFLICGIWMLIFSLLPGGALAGLIPGVMWIAAPLFVPFMDQPRRTLPRLTESERESVLHLCRDTWHFFEKNVHSGTCYLPPDNVQLQPEKGPALRTSPTNMGLYLLSTLAAKELRLITPAQMARRMLHTVETMERLETLQGHFYNWYDLCTLSPLQPRFISTVDSGNLCACLLACAQGVRACLEDLGEEGRTLPARLDKMAKGMDFRPLFDPGASLFHIGYDADANALTKSHYDLLASENRLTSFVAVMQRQVPLKHWFALGRNAVRRAGGSVLLSWGGTAFEYLMPHLLLPLYPGTLLQESCLNMIRAQIADAPHHPFGISESGYFAFDPDMQYQYRAFGLPALSLSGHTRGTVIAPYASMLALPFLPRAAIRNLKWMRRLSWYSEEGLFEAADYTPAPLEKTPRLVESHMAHHQGMILCSACNLLTDFSLVRHFMAPAEPRAYAYLLCEGRPALPPMDAPLPYTPSRQKKYIFSFPAPPVSAHVLSGKDVTWLMDSKGSGALFSRDRLWTRFFPSAPCGPQFYLRNVQTGACIRPQGMGEMIFENGCIRIPIRAFQVSGEMRLFVLPLNGEAVMDLQLENKHSLNMQLEVISFLEVTRTPYLPDVAHPHFRDLSSSVQPFMQDGLVCHTRGDKPIPLLLHRVLGDVKSIRMQGDRLLFLGRDGDYHSPVQTRLPADQCTFRTGDTLAPCLSLRCLVSLHPGEKAHLQFITCEADLPADIDPSDELLPPAALALCGQKAAMTLGFLHISPDAMPLYCRMLGALCRFPAPLYAPPPPFETLFPFGISGNEPLMCVYLSGPDKPLIRHALAAHALFRTSGVKSVLLFVCNEGAEGYVTPLQNAVREQIHSLKGGQEGIHITGGNEAVAARLRPLSRLFLQSGMPLSQQLSALPETREDNPPPALPPSPLPPALLYANPCGGFTQEGDYCIFALPPSPWHNLLMGQRFGTLVCENAVLHSFCDNSHLHPITKKATDVHRPEGAEEYTLEAEGGHLLSLSGGLMFHRPGITEYHSLPFRVKTKLTVCSHPSFPAGLRIITLQTDEEGTYNFCWKIHFSLGSSTFVQMNNNLLLAFGAKQTGCAFALMPGGDARPLNDGSGCFHAQITLEKHKSQTFPLYIGYAATPQEATCTAATLLQQGHASFLRSVQAFWQERLDGLKLFGGEKWLSLYMNGWLPYQTYASRLLGRTGPYQPGGAFGFRDQLQDLLCCLHTTPEYARQHLLLSAAHQYAQGDVQHWWHPPRTGVRTRISDDKLFLPYMTALYVLISGDETILNEQVPVLLSPPLEEHEQDRYETPSVSHYTATLMEHCLLAIHSVQFSPRGLPLMGSGDWNDGLNRVAGESVWLGFFLCMVYRQFAPLCDQETEKALMEKRHRLLQALECAWTGKWYLRAWYKNGDALAGPDTMPPRIDLMSQVFACLAGAPRQHARKALQSALDILWKKDHGQVLLLHPPFGPAENAGYIGHYLPGVRENGGQYTHALPWLIMALCDMGEYQTAWQIARDLLPIFHTDTLEKLLRYKKEPYVLCGDISAGENPGQGGWSWYTGSAAWLYYAVLTCLLGLEKRGKLIRLHPAPLPDGEEFTLVYRFGTSTWHLTAGPDIPFATVDGERLKDGWVHLHDDGHTHAVRFPYRKS